VRRQRNGYGYKIILLAAMILLIPFFVSYPKAIDGRLRQSANDTAVTVLNYHKIADDNIALAVSPPDFAKQMAYLAEEGYTTISPDDLLENQLNGKPLPEKPVLITFDDGYEDNYVNAYPILKQYGFKATIFVITDYLSQNSAYLTWEQAREMQAGGMTIASHTMQHKPLTELGDAELKRELEGSKAAIEYQMGAQNVYLAYPTGAYNLKVMKQVEEAGYKGAFTIKYGGVNAASSLYALERVPIFRTQDTFANFKWRIHNIPLFERLGLIKS
jgi:peptidoglycan/xylan/chitin deacetylase (PgdA/CDA1 family)